VTSPGGTDDERELVPADAVLLRFLGIDHLPKAPGQTRPNSDLFKPSSDGSGASVIVVANEGEVAAAKARHPDVTYWVRIDVATVREELKLEVIWDNAYEGADPQHGAIVGWPTPKSKIAKLRTLLVQKCQWDGPQPPFTPAVDGETVV
jgi:hypothetical protein